MSVADDDLLAPAEVGVLVRAAATLVPKLAHCVERCTSEADPGQELARACGAVASQYLVLQRELDRLPRSGLTDEVDRLLSYQQLVLAQAANLAFRPHSAGWYRLAARFGDGWGEPADRLIQLAARLSAPARGICRPDDDTA